MNKGFLKKVENIKINDNELLLHLFDLYSTSQGGSNISIGIYIWDKYKTNIQKIEKLSLEIEKMIPNHQDYSYKGITNNGDLYFKRHILNSAYSDYNKGTYNKVGIFLYFRNFSEFKEFAIKNRGKKLKTCFNRILEDGSFIGIVKYSKDIF